MHTWTTIVSLPLCAALTAVGLALSWLTWRRKGARRGIRAAAWSLLQADPRSCVALEDSPNGVASAEAAGCTLIAAPSLVPIPARPGRVVVTSLSQVDLAMLRALVAAR